MPPTTQHIRQLSLRKEIEGHAIKVDVECTLAGELIRVSSPFWLLPVAARRLTYGQAAHKIDQRLNDLIQNFRFLLPILVVPEHLLPTNLETEDRRLAHLLRTQLTTLPYREQKALRESIQDQWAKSILITAWQKADMAFRRKLELVYDLVTVQKMNVYKLVGELKTQSDPLFTWPLITGLSRKNTTFRSFASRWLHDHLAEEMIPQLLIALDGSDEWTKTTVLDLLEKLKTDKALDKASGLLLNDPSEKVRSKAAYFLGVVADKSSVPPLLKALEAPAWIVRQNALEALGKISAPSAAPPLIQLLAQAADTDKSDIIIALGYHPYPGVAEVLLPYLHHRTLRYVTIAALGKIGDPVALPTIQQIYEETIHPAKRRSIKKVMEGLALNCG